MKISYLAVLSALLIGCSDNSNVKLAQEESNIDLAPEGLQKEPSAEQPEPAAATTLGSDQTPNNKPNLQALYDDYFNVATSLYTGSTASEALNLSAMSYFMSTATLGVFPNEQYISEANDSARAWTVMSLEDLANLPLFSMSSDNPRDELINGSLDCSYEGTMQVDSQKYSNEEDADSYQFIVNYSNCKNNEFGLAFDGLVEIYFSIDDIQNEAINSMLDERFLYRGIDEYYQDMLITYKSLKVSNSDRTVEVDGALRWEDPTSCGLQGLKKLTVHMREINSQQSMLLENVEQGWRGTNRYYCARDLTKHTYLKGKLLDSSFGEINIESPDINYSDDYIRPDSSAYADIEITAGGTKAELVDIEDTDLVYPWGHRQRGRRLELGLLDEQSNKTHFYSFSASMWQKGAVLDLNDDDGDGMGNSWEASVGLNPGNAADAEQDLDDDGITNLIEFKSAGDPHLRSNGGINNDMSLVHDDFFTLINRDNSVNLYLSIYGQLVEDMFTIRDDYLLIESNLNGTWETFTYGCDVTNEGRSIVCTSSAGSGFSGTFKPSENGTLSLKATLLQTPFDYNPENNIFILELDYP